MVGWDAQDDPAGMAVSAAVVLPAGVAIAWYASADAGHVTAVDAVVGVAVGASAVAAQTGAGLRQQAGAPLFGSDWGRWLVGLAAAVALVWFVRTYPAMAVPFGLTLAVLGVGSRVFLYARATGR